MAWNGSDGGVGKSTQRTPSARDAKGYGRAGARPSREGSASRTSRVKGLVALAVVVVGGGLAWWWVGGRGGHAGGAPRTSRPTERLIKEQWPAAVARKRNPPAPVTPKKPKAPAATQPRVVAVETNAMGAVIEDLVLPDGREIRRITPPPPVWDNAADQLIAMTISIESGVDAPPLPVGVSDREFLQALKKPIVINAEDPASLQRLKRQVREARNEILDTMAETGKSFEEILNEHRDAMNDGTALWRMAQEDYASARETMTDEEREEYVAKVNALLEERGARPLSTEGRRRGRPRDSQ